MNQADQAHQKAKLLHEMSTCAKQASSFGVSVTKRDDQIHAKDSLDLVSLSNPDTAPRTLLRDHANSGCTINDFWLLGNLLFVDYVKGSTRSSVFFDCSRMKRLHCSTSTLTSNPSQFTQHSWRSWCQLNNHLNSEVMWLLMNIK